MNVVVLCSKRSTEDEIRKAAVSLPLECSWEFFFDTDTCEAYVQEHHPAAVLIDHDIGNADPHALTVRLKERCPGMSVVFLAEKDACIDAGRIFDGGGYVILHPIDVFTLTDTVERIYNVSANMRRRIKVRMFGVFDVFVNGKVIDFGNEKAKELLALCFDREGDAVSMETAANALWADRPYDDKVKASYRKATMCCAKQLKKYGIGDIFHKERGTTWVDTSEVFCDYYRFLQGDRWIVAKLPSTSYYLYQYDWALNRHPLLEERHKQYLEDYGMACKSIDATKYSELRK